MNNSMLECGNSQIYIIQIDNRIDDQSRHINSWAQLAGAVEYTDCISAEGKDSPNECPRYDTKTI